MGKKLETMKKNLVPKRGMIGRAVQNRRARRERRYRRKREHWFFFGVVEGGVR